jgi:hypothetical protein
MIPSRLLASAALLLTAGTALAQTPPAPAPMMPHHVPVAVPVDPAIVALRDRALADDTAWSIVAGLTSEVGPRMDGSPAEARARDWAVARLTALGFANVHVELFTLPVWQRGAESGAVVAPYPQPLRLVGLGNSGATPPGGLTLPVVYFASFNDLLQAGEGTFGRVRFSGPGEAAKRGAAAIVIRSIGTDHGRGPHAGATDFEPGVTPIPAAALSVADAENLERMVRLGKPVTLHLELDDHQVGTRTSGNVVAEVPGTDPDAGVIVIGGHLDSWDLGTGAIDDGAGIAITTAAARLLKEMGPHRRTIRVVWFGDEETGGFGGAAYGQAHAHEPHAMAAESDVGADRVWRFRSTLPKPLGDRIAAALEPLGIVHDDGHVMGGTDVEPTIALGAPGVDLNQSALRYFDWHHTPEDTLDRIDPEQLRQNVAAWAVTVALVADAPEGLKK